MSAYRDVLAIHDDSSDERIALAAERLSNGRGVVLWGDVLALRRMSAGIRCEVIDPTPGAHRCAEEFKVLVENAGRALGASKLGRLIADWPLQWAVVEARGSGTLELWPEPSGDRQDDA
jgi:hypothetical protein